MPIFLFCHNSVSDQVEIVEENFCREEQMSDPEPDDLQVWNTCRWCKKPYFLICENPDCPNPYRK